jgi:hypothetical protein
MYLDLINILYSSSKEIAKNLIVLFQVRSARAVEDLQRKELEDQLEAEAYFSGLYKTQVLPVLPGISGSGSRIRIPLAPIKKVQQNILKIQLFCCFDLFSQEKKNADF